MKTGQGICGGLGTQTYKNLEYTGPSFHWDLKVTVLINSLVIAGGPTWFSVPVRLKDMMLGENSKLDCEGKDKHLQGRRGFFGLSSRRMYMELLSLGIVR